MADAHDVRNGYVIVDDSEIHKNIVTIGRQLPCVWTEEPGVGGKWLPVRSLPTDNPSITTPVWVKCALTSLMGTAPYRAWLPLSSCTDGLMFSQDLPVKLCNWTVGSTYDKWLPIDESYDAEKPTAVMCGLLADGNTWGPLGADKAIIWATHQALKTQAASALKQPLSIFWRARKELVDPGREDRMGRQNGSQRGAIFFASTWLIRQREAWSGKEGVLG